MQFKAALTINSESIELSLLIVCFPNELKPKFTIMLIGEKCVVRLNYGEDCSHNNHPIKGIITPLGIEYGEIEGSNYHSWQDNRHLASPIKYPNELEFARQLPLNIQSFENCFRWFCAENNVIIAGEKIPELPLRERLL
jgi:hypothetical protein